MRIWNPIWIFLALKDQLPLKRFYRNFFITGNGRGLFHPRSHFTASGKPKVGYNTKASAIKSAESLGKKRNCYFSNYRCMWCGKFHLGRNRDNK
jgi:hypothetical protein